MRLSVQQSLLRAKKHAKKGETAAARQLYLEILEKFPKNKPAQSGLAALSGPMPPQNQINGLVALHTQGRLSEVVKHAQALIRLYPDTVFLHNIMGAACIGLARIDSAITCFNRALQIEPGNVQALNNLGGALKQRGDLKAAISSYQAALQIEPDNPELHNNLGIAQNQADDIDAARQSFHRALALAPDNLKYITSLCDFYEKTNDLDSLSEILGHIDDAAAADANVRYYAAQLGFRKKDFTRAKDLIAQIDPAKLTKKRQFAYYELKGKLCDKLGLYDEAFGAFSDMNQRIIQSPEFRKIDADGYFRYVSSELQSLQQAAKHPANGNTAAAPVPDTPCFLVGFPRSGTTLLDTILRSHSKIDVIEEQPMVMAAKSLLDENTPLHALETLSRQKLSGLQSAYFTELDKHKGNFEAGKVCIDKLPFNALEAPLIHAMFPVAKFILAIRHPYDSILSCYMQHFKLNTHMANLVDLERIVGFYDVTMATWDAAQKRYGLDYHMIRYEDLVADMQSQIAALVTFLGVEWEEAITDYQKTALERGKINTPSYSQVVQPLYKDATYRWKNYREHLEKYDDRIQPWIKRFGY